MHEESKAILFYYRIASIWNELDQNVVENLTVNSFKARIDNARKDKANKFTITKPSHAEDDEMFRKILMNF